MEKRNKDGETFAEFLEQIKKGPNFTKETFLVSEQMWRKYLEFEGYTKEEINAAVKNIKERQKDGLKNQLT
jgi:hypothetical protein